MPSNTGNNFPLVYFLLPGKTREVCITSFILLKEAAQNSGLEVDPHRVLTDFWPYSNLLPSAYHKLKRRGVYSTTHSQAI